MRRVQRKSPSGVRAVMRQAEKVAAARGSATAATLDRVRETLHAAALDAVAAAVIVERWLAAPNDAITVDPDTISQPGAAE